MIGQLLGMNPVLRLLIRLPWAAALALPAFGAQDGAVFTSLYSFTGGNDGAGPVAPLVQGSDGNFYGTTYQGGTNGVGTVFQISTNGALTSLYSFTGSNDGANPVAGLIQATDGSLYGTASGGPYYGTIFRITTNGAFSLIYSFTGTDDGAYPEAALIQASDGSFYGTASAGGINGLGTVFRLSANGDFNSIFSFNDTDGSTPVAALLQAADGYLYGTTSSGTGLADSGTIFRISTNGAFNSLHLFNRAIDGWEPRASLIQASDGSLYGTTVAGGTSGYGTVFAITTNGAYTTLCSINQPDFAGRDTYPSGLVQGSDANFYVPLYLGNVFEVTTNGSYSNLYLFAGSTGPIAFSCCPSSLVQGNDGNFYGTTRFGGVAGTGTVFGTVFRMRVVPAFQAATITNGTLNLRWSTEARGMYQLQCTSDLSSSNWTNLDSVVIATGATLNTTDSITTSPQRFYRVVLLP
jgi:uncharacterized repeat protein (TIGR03803 family)